jgi:hypothetical protein
MSNVEAVPDLNIIMFDNVYVREYTPADRELIENFRQATFDEGNDSLSVNVYDPDNIKGQTWMTFVGDELASISVVERSHYTGDPDIAGRICRYHILKKFRHSNAGFRMLSLQVQWAKDNGLKVLYWTHNVNNKALNALYQHKKTMPFRGEAVPYFLTETYQNFKLSTNMIFRVSPKSDFLQYMYVNILEPDYVWEPQAKTVIYITHNGEITDEIKTTALSISDLA